MAETAQHEDAPRNLAERFVDRLKQMTIGGYYTSEIGICQDLGYRGNTAVDEFLGYTHEAHA